MELKLTNSDLKLMLQIMNVAAGHYPSTLHEDTWNSLYKLRDRLEGWVGQVREELE